MNTDPVMTGDLAGELKKLSDQDLHHRMLAVSGKERELTMRMISMIEEAGRRKFYLDFGFASLFDYLTKGLKYSAGAAMRRISAARIAREIPEVKGRILEGSLSLSNLSQAEQFFRNEKKYSQGLNAEKKREVLNQMENKSTRECEKILVALSSVPAEQLKEDKLKPLTPELTQITFKADAAFMAQLEEVRSLLAHQMPHATVTEIMSEVMKAALARLRKQKFKVADAEKQSEGYTPLERIKSLEDMATKDEEYVVADAMEDFSKNLEEDLPKAFVENLKSVSRAGNSRYIPASVSREVYERDRGRCVVVNPKAGKPCGRKWKLQFDHFPTPFAMGGASTISNLRLTCESCNRLHAVNRYGRDKVVSKINRV